jgi:hypothetical protein
VTRVRASTTLIRLALAPILAAARRGREGLPKRPPWVCTREREEATSRAWRKRAVALTATLAERSRELAEVRLAALGPGRESREATADVVRCLRESHDDLLGTVLEQAATIVDLTSEIEERSRSSS